MTITLANTSGRLAVLLLEHELTCVASGRCGCERRRDGTPLPASLTLAAGERRAELPEALLQLPTVQAALRRGALRVEHTPYPPEPGLAIAVPQDGGPAGAPIPPIEVPHERRAAVVQGRRR